MSQIIFNSVHFFLVERDLIGCRLSPSLLPPSYTRTRWTRWTFSPRRSISEVTPLFNVQPLSSSVSPFGFFRRSDGEKWTQTEAPSLPESWAFVWWWAKWSDDGIFISKRCCCSEVRLLTICRNPTRAQNVQTGFILSDRLDQTSIPILPLGGASEEIKGLTDGSVRKDGRSYISRKWVLHVSANVLGFYFELETGSADLFLPCIA